MRSIGLAAMLMLGAATPLRADPPEPKCLVPSHSWDGVEALTAGPPAASPSVTVGKPAMVALADAAQVRFVVPLGKPVSAGDKGGIVSLHVAEAGTYRIALQRKAWIDVVRDGKALASVAHTHGAPCSGIAKMVDFALAPGDYAIQLSDTADATIGLSVTKQP